MLCNLYCRGILLPCAIFHQNWTTSCWVMAKNDFQYGGHLSFWILKIFTFGHMTVKFQIYWTCTKFWSKSNDFSLRYDEIRQISRRQMSAILNFRGPRMGFLKSPCRTSYWLSIETTALKCLVFETRSSTVAETAWRFTSLNTLLSHSRSLKVIKMTLLHTACVSPY